MKAERISNVVLAERLGLSEGAVRRLVNPGHASRVDGVVSALAALGHNVIVEAHQQNTNDAWQ
ncbi:AsnC family protein [Halomonas sp. V046]|uniref:AsnC family protein n=1 Tax=Halomonas sp. V046 TaxID=3459611 RepID=UPI004044EC50